MSDAKMNAAPLSVAEARKLFADTKGKEQMAATCNAIAERLIAGVEDEDTLVTILDDKELWDARDQASEALAAKSMNGARLVLDRLDRASWKARRRAVAWFDPAEVYDLFVAKLPTMKPTHARELWFAILETPGAARDPRWVARVDPAESAGLNGVAMLSAIGRDLGHPAGEEAVAKLLEAMENTGDSVKRNFYAYAIGDIGRPSAVPALLRQLARQKYASVIIRALGQCGGADVIPTLRERAASSADEKVDCEHAIAAIRTRGIAQDPMLAALAGDPDAAAVLEDALRERGLL